MVEVDLFKAARFLILGGLAAMLFVTAFVAWFQDDDSTVRTEVTKESPPPQQPATNQATGTAAASPTLPVPTATQAATGLVLAERSVTTEVTTGSSGDRSETVMVALLALGGVLALLALFGDRVQTIKGGGVELTFKDIKDIKDEASKQLAQTSDPAHQQAITRALLVAIDRALDVNRKDD